MPERWYDDLVDWDTVLHPIDAVLQISGRVLVTIGVVVVFGFGIWQFLRLLGWVARLMQP